jgi:hypothetical protein
MIRGIGASVRKERARWPTPDKVASTARRVLILSAKRLLQRSARSGLLCGKKKMMPPSACAQA